MAQGEEEAMVQRERDRSERSVQGKYLTQAAVMASQKGTQQQERTDRLSSVGK
jgi:hypothetical protein